MKIYRKNIHFGRLWLLKEQTQTHTSRRTRSMNPVNSDTDNSFAFSTTQHTIRHIGYYSFKNSIILIGCLSFKEAINFQMNRWCRDHEQKKTRILIFSKKMETRVSLFLIRIT